MRHLALTLTALAVLGSLRARAEPQLLKQEEVEQIVAQAAAKASNISPNSIIAVTDRDGFILAIWDCGNRVPSPLPTFPAVPFPPPKGDNLAFSVVKTYALVAGAITRASTAAFLSSDQNAFTTRTAGFIIQQHFPPGVRNTPAGPLVGVGFSSLFFSDVNRAKLIPPGFNGAVEIPPTISPGIRAPLFPLTSLNDSPGGVPLYKGGKLVGGIGVVGDDSPTDLAPAGAIFFKETQREATTGFKYEDDTDELVALAGQTHFRPDDSILATNAFINGIRVPYVNQRPEDIQDVHDVPPLSRLGRPIDVPIVLAVPGVPSSAILVPGARDLAKSTLLSTAFPNQVVPFGTVALGYPQAAPKAYPYEVARLGGFEGQIRFPFRDDPWRNHQNPKRRKINGKASRLSKAEVKDIISLSAYRARITRAGIRLPLGTNMKVFITVVANPDRPGVPPPILGVFGTGEATIFSWDVAVQKARTAIFFSNTQIAMSSRTIGFLAQRFYPPGIDGTANGPFFGFQEATSLRSSPLTAFFPGDPNLPNAITIFPGGFPLYRNGYLIGAVGVSGDGVDQDDIVAISGTEDFRPKVKIRADNYAYRGARLPFAKFPRDPVR